MSYQRSAEAAEELVARDPITPVHWEDLAIAHQRLADLDYALGRPEQAGVGYGRFLEAAARLDALEFDSPIFEELPIARQRLADLQRRRQV